MILAVITMILLAILWPVAMGRILKFSFYLFSVFIIFLLVFWAAMLAFAT